MVIPDRDTPHLLKNTSAVKSVGRPPTGQFGLQPDLVSYRITQKRRARRVRADSEFFEHCFSFVDSTLNVFDFLEYRFDGCRSLGDRAPAVFHKAFIDLCTELG